MAVGDTIVVDGVEYEVVWAGGEGLTADRQTKPSDTWTPPPRIYNKTGKHAKKNKPATKDIVVVVKDGELDGERERESGEDGD